MDNPYAAETIVEPPVVIQSETTGLTMFEAEELTHKLRELLNGVERKLERRRNPSPWGETTAIISFLFAVVLILGGFGFVLGWLARDMWGAS